MAAARRRPTIGVMRRLAAAIALLALACAMPLAVAQASPDAGITAAQLTSRFKQATGDKLLLNRKISYAGHYKAYDLGVPSIAKKAKYGTFTIHLVTGADVEAEVEDLLADGHTGMLGTPGPSNIYWEQGSSIYGDKYWLAKKRYGANVVLWWIGEKPVKKIDRTFKRLHAALLKVTR
jgi:hypothetical protein